MDQISEYQSDRNSRDCNCMPKLLVSKVNSNCDSFIDSQPYNTYIKVDNSSIDSRLSSLTECEDNKDLENKDTLRNIITILSIGNSTNKSSKTNTDKVKKSEDKTLANIQIPADF